MMKKYCPIGGVALSGALLCAGLNAQSLSPHDFPDGKTWLVHAQQGLAPYWMMQSAQGIPMGNFPTFRCDNGQILDVTKVCQELNKNWITPYFGREYTRMKSRQTYAYGVLYHLTGDPHALQLAKAGTEYLMNQLQDKEHGGFISFTEHGQAGLEWQQRTSQDQAYALVGLAMYYYLTRDLEVEKVLINQQRFIFDNYRLDDGKGLAWVLKDGDGESTKQRELVAQLDQINGYLLLVAPLLPEPHKSRWLADLSWLTDTMLKQYYAPQEQRFYGAIHHPAVMNQQAKHNDFGHTIKAYWMTYLTGELLQRQDWQKLAKQGMQHIIEQAQYVPNYADIKGFVPEMTQEQWQASSIKAWRNRPFSYGISSWEWAELDQAAMTLSLLEDQVKPVLQSTAKAFMQVWVDDQYGGVGLNPKSTKAFHWGNGYHQFEHALVGYLTAQQLNQRPARLYFAIDDPQSYQLSPYYFQGQIKSQQRLTTVNGLPRWQVEFTAIKP
ncbi:N-acylglucosamine 2-epimerase [Vibrio sp. V27_P1S3P104]|uniref:AGE family epimerase/isomerase n=1 Tax=unclassified Vibrio TaxID=2614977 RepID=UPI0013737EF4|nr:MULTISPECIES: AGE family epimerase/isomerase [unclassified Vibrio]NAW68931.1 N-acylglucosamine 2-epimerase [Vibrio sp. V28_P6S34P95]NAX05128.1 N-acylglucosamine 2-epimerase [Vibrio sp. V30_P3S12P165]NAX34159.1 N-acylglucosamine 2-epimerase [Vibrio sp. V29_P1S30P107]NAX37608.1 N-acylglucosamine 2-epimerase [Vibrio sp. V27_P1S3P104]NAX41757.1 N-acylglucosamine 2-epimerase [Vibrio sp. V26_P1S5P106]